MNIFSFFRSKQQKHYTPFFEQITLRGVETQKSAENLLNFLSGKNYRSNFLFHGLEKQFLDNFKNSTIENLVGSDSLQILYNIQLRVKVISKKEPDLIDTFKTLSEKLDFILNPHSSEHSTMIKRNN
jgi:hypothetical protein